MYNAIEFRELLSAILSRDSKPTGGRYCCWVQWHQSPVLLATDDCPSKSFFPRKRKSVGKASSYNMQLNE